ncbi:hypothetical protein JI56_02090 [SAR11 cluster bacterium PRT-SC02]|nr:hypothetical protein JI56_02090 [SAR11 cluster bacterium PRT-SC02]
MADTKLMINEIKFKKILSEVITKEDKIIVLYSGIWSFIKKINFNINNPKKIPEVILDLFEEKIGKDKTLFLPSFTGESFYKKKYFSIDTDIDKLNGFIPIAALKRSYFRTKQPIHSYLVFGNLKEVRKLKLKSSWGKKSLLEFFQKKNARICNLGLPWNKGCAYLHRYEEIYNVPWRYHKIFSKKIIKNKRIIGNCREKKFCTSLSTPVNYDYKPFIKYIKKSKSFRKANPKDLSMESIKTSCLDKIGKRIFTKNPWVIVKNKKTIINWIKNKKNSEIKRENFKSIY